MNRFVLYSLEEGVFLGHALGLAFFSNSDTAGQTAAPTFANAEEAAELLALLGPLELMPVMADQGEYASMAACVAAGLPGWLSADTLTHNCLPV